VKAISGKDFCRVLERHGWNLLRIRGSHHMYGKTDVVAIISVPVHSNRPLKPGILRFFLRQAGLSEEEL
jgi:predicted RNA binding protein YcfA (HicA-like mRNA interferase family)